MQTGDYLMTIIPQNTNKHIQYHSYHSHGPILDFLAQVTAN